MVPLRKPFRKMGQGIAGIIGPGQVKLDLAGPEFGIILYRLIDHLVAVVVVQKGRFGLEGVLRGDHKPDLLEVSKLHKVVGDDQMADMDGIEGPKKEAHLFHSLSRFGIFLAPTKSATRAWEASRASCRS